jgi:hypothetical protein
MQTKLRAVQRTGQGNRMMWIIIFSNVTLSKTKMIETITTHLLYLFGPKEGERGFDPRELFPPPKIKFGDDVLEEMKNGISVSVVAYTEIDNGGNFTVFLTGFGGLDFAEWSLVALLDSDTDFDFSDVKIFLVIVVVFDLELISFSFCIISFPFRICSLSVSDVDSYKITIATKVSGISMIINEWERKKLFSEIMIIKHYDHYCTSEIIF